MYAVMGILAGGELEVDKQKKGEQQQAQPAGISSHLQDHFSQHTW